MRKLFSSLNLPKLIKRLDTWLSQNSKLINSVFVGLIGLDFVWKIILVHYFSPDNYFINSGLALSFQPLSTNSLIIILGIVLFVFTLGVVFFRHKIQNSLIPLILIFLLAGWNNYLDRLQFGGVIDYINFFGLFWCNATDIVLTLVTLSLILKSALPETAKV